MGETSGASQASGQGTREQPWLLKTPPGASEFTTGSVSDRLPWTEVITCGSCEKPNTPWPFDKGHGVFGGTLFVEPGGPLPERGSGSPFPLVPRV